jgi:hypothetical protein
MANHWQPAIRALIYCTQFDDDPTQAVDHVIQTVVAKRALGRERDEFREAIASALSSTESLATLIPQPHSEEVIRRFLELVLARL